MHHIPPNPFTDPSKLAKKSIFERAGDKARSFIDAAFDSALEAVKKKEKQKKILPTAELQEIWDNIEAKIESGEIEGIELTIGGKTKVQLETSFKDKKIYITSHAQDMLNSKDFATSAKPEQLNLVKLSVKDLGFPNGATYKEICDKANELGLDLCPAEVGPHLRLQDDTQSMGDYYNIAMKPISDRDGGPNIFRLFQVGDDLWLHSDHGRPDVRYYADDPFVFVSRK
ncbi:hypothetical protein IT409_01760 [Candidatus Falkowbacteria bacterium]|nr:hypothetical protein [Candidatus Falkowbacteria bacterium]